MKPTLVVMAAGMGSRFGGLKQMTPVGPGGEMLLDYSVYDARLAGFEKVVFVIKHEIEHDFKALVGDRIAAHFPVEYAYQSLDDLPGGYTVPDGREKPWGTGQAIWACRHVLHEPFAVVNADDFYGRGCFKLMHDFIVNDMHGGDKMSFAMAGYRLCNTLTENGSVSRGVCVVNEDGYLEKLDERKRIELIDGKPYFTLDGENWTELDPNAYVSMNCWACPAETVNILGGMFDRFLAAPKENPLKDEFYLPISIDTLVHEGKATVKVLPTPDRWYGMTYPEDKQSVIDALSDMVKAGIYPEKLWK